MHSATLSVFDNTSSSPQHVAATGSGADMTVTPASYAFGNVKIGSKATKSITVSHKQNIAASLTLPPGFTGTNSGDFSQTGGTCTSTLAAKTNCTLVVTYAATVLGTESATMTVTDSPDPLSPYTVSFTTGDNIPVTVLPTTLAFGTLTKSTKTKNIMVTNLSGFPLSVSESSVTGTDAGEFALTGGKCRVSVQLTRVAR